MKNLILLPILFLTLTVFAEQNPITFKLEGTQPQPDKSIINLKRPVEFKFDKNFNGKSIEFRDKDGKDIIAFKDVKFGDNILKPSGDSFQITIQEDGSTIPYNPLKITEDFKIYIEGANPISVTFDKIVIDRMLEEKENEKNYQLGYIFYDALKIVESKDQPLLVLEILKGYGVNKDTYENNPYLESVYLEALSKGGVEGAEIKNLMTNLGNTDVTIWAVALAKILAEHFKEELKMSFFDKMNRELNRYPELKTVFPKTASILDNIHSYSIDAVFPALKENFEIDMITFPDNFYRLRYLTELDCGEYKPEKCIERMNSLQSFYKTTEGKWFILGMYTLKEARYSTNPAYLMNNISTSNDKEELKENLENESLFSEYNVISAIEFCNLLSQSLISKDSSLVWVNRQQINELVNNAEAFNIYLGLIVARSHTLDIDFYDSNENKKNLAYLLIEKKDKIKEIRNLIENTHYIFNTTNIALQNIQKSLKDSSLENNVKDFYNYYNSVTNALYPVMHSSFLTSVNPNIPYGYNKVVEILNPSVQLVYHISVKKYSSAIYDASALLSNFPEIESKNKKLVNIGASISTIAMAENSDEAKKALEAVMLPTGSSSLKRESNFNISINSYVGGYYGWIPGGFTSYNYDSTGVITDSLLIKSSYGLYAPIGVTFSGLRMGKGGSWSLGLQLLDLGALVNFYLVEGDEAALPNDFTVKLSNIFAPGAFLGYNIPKTPLTFMGGVQWIPSLYKTDQISSGGLNTTPSAWRWQVGLTVDIPIINLFTRSY
jgi:hypothetical protein